MDTKIVAVIIGNEILAGRRQDSHFAQTVTSLQKHNLRLTQALYLPDDFDVLVETYQRLHNEGAIILSFGGIGATPDDCTRAAVAKAFDKPLICHPEGLKMMQEKYASDINEHRKQLVAFPEGAELIPNPVNQIPGFSIQRVHCVPGFPQMATPMIRWVLDKNYANLGRARSYQSIIVQLPESKITALMEDLEAKYPEVSISSLPKMQHGLELGFDGDEIQVNDAKKAAISWLDRREVSYQLN